MTGPDSCLYILNKYVCYYILYFVPQDKMLNFVRLLKIIITFLIIISRKFMYLISAILSLRITDSNYLHLLYLFPCFRECATVPGTFYGNNNVWNAIINYLVIHRSFFIKISTLISDVLFGARNARRSPKADYFIVKRTILVFFFSSKIWPRVL